MAYILISAGAGTVAGAVVMVLGLVFTVNAILTPLGEPSLGCGMGNLMGFLSLFTGAFLGTVGGSVFAVKKPIYKAGGLS